MAKRNKRKFAGYHKITGELFTFKVKIHAYHIITKKRIVITCFIKDIHISNISMCRGNFKPSIATPRLNKYYKIHNQYAPAIMIYDAEDNLMLESWYFHGTNYNAEGPVESHILNGVVTKKIFKFNWNNSSIEYNYSSKGILKSIIQNSFRTESSAKSLWLISSDEVRFFRADGSALEQTLKTVKSNTNPRIVPCISLKTTIFNKPTKKYDQIVVEKEIKNFNMSAKYDAHGKKTFYKNLQVAKTLYFVEEMLPNIKTSSSEIIKRTKYTEEEWDNFQLLG